MQWQTSTGEKKIVNKMKKSLKKIFRGEIQEHVFLWEDGDPCPQPAQLNATEMDPCMFLKGDWSRQITWPKYWPLIGPDWSTDHVTMASLVTSLKKLKAFCFQLYHWKLLCGLNCHDPKVQQPIGEATTIKASVKISQWLIVALLLHLFKRVI